MRNRHLPTPFTITGIDQYDCNQLPPEQSYIPMGRAVAPENGSFVCPMDHALRGGLHHDSQWNSEGRASEYPSSSLSMEVQHCPPAFSGPPYDPYPHSSVTGNISLAPTNNVPHVHSRRFNDLAIRDIEDGRMKGPFKRKSPDISGAFERGCSSRFYNPGSSSSSSQMLLDKPTADCHNVPSYRGTSLSIAGEDSLRNVRSRSRLELEPNTTRTHLSSYSSHLYHSTTRPTSHSVPVHPANLNADPTGREWNCVPLYAPLTHGRIPTPDINGTSHETSQILVGGSAAAIGACHHDSVFNRHPVSSQYAHGPHAQAAREHINFSRRATPSHRNGLSSSHLGHGPASSTNGLNSLSESYSSRYSRHSSAGGWRGSYRNGRSRMAVERLEPIVGVVGAHDRMGSVPLMMVDRASFYGGSRSFLDQYRDMRLDIDSMSYEELVALEERIGNVSTGLSEDTMSYCLTEKVYCSSDRNDEEVSCPICLEEYKNGEKVGTMKCGHEYHVDCIKKWLLMKNVCPICKAECSNKE